MDLKQLQSFVTVVRLHSFSKAAEELFLSQPTVSMHIHQLETELHTRLIIRSTKSFSVSPKGQEVYDYAVRILSLRDHMVENCSVENRRTIRIGASSIPSGYVLPEILPAYAAAHPDVQFTVEQKDSEEITDMLLHDKIDLGLIGMDPEDERITAIPFYADPIVVITPASDRFLAMQKQGDQALAALLKEPVILREEGSGSRHAAVLALQGAGFTEKDLHIVARMSDQEAIKNMVAGGLGISFMSAKSVRNVRDEQRLLAFPFPGPRNVRHLYIIYRSEYLLKSFSGSFIRHLIRHYRTQPDHG